MKDEIKQLTLLQEIITESPAILVYFFNDGCAPCISLRPKVQNLIDEEFPEMKIAFVNAKLTPELASEYGIYESPTMLVFFEGKETVRKGKYTSIEDLKTTISRYYSILFS